MEKGHHIFAKCSSVLTGSQHSQTTSTCYLETSFLVDFYVVMVFQIHTLSMHPGCMLCKIVSTWTSYSFVFGRLFCCSAPAPWAITSTFRIYILMMPKSKYLTPFLSWLYIEILEHFACIHLLLCTRTLLSMTYTLLTSELCKGELCLSPFLFVYEHKNRI